MGDTAELLMEARTPASATVPAVAQRPRRPVIRQYELVERVRSYDPEADEDLLEQAELLVVRIEPAQIGVGLRRGGETGEDRVAVGHRGTLVEQRGDAAGVAAQASARVRAKRAGIRGKASDSAVDCSGCGRGFSPDAPRERPSGLKPLPQ